MYENGDAIQLPHAFPQAHNGLEGRTSASRLAGPHELGEASSQSTGGSLHHLAESVAEKPSAMARQIGDLARARPGGATATLFAAQQALARWTA
jgi:hypothetical protein